MNHRRWHRAFFVLAAGTLLSSSGAFAQVSPERCVLGAGATTAANDRFAVAGTFGQPIIGRSTSSSHSGMFGFWYTLPRTEATAVRTGSSVSASGALRIAPNPIVTLAQVRIKNPAAGRVTLRIFDALGRERQTVIDQTREAGEIGLELDVTALESGSYSAVLLLDGSQHVLPLRIVR
jgi:hypothetical protein